MSSKETFRKTFMEKGKRGQVTIFIIVGILIVIIVGGLLFVNRDDINFRGTTSVQVEPVREYIRECINEELESLLPEMRKYGGYRSLDSSNSHRFNGVDFNLLNQHLSGTFSSSENLEPDKTIRNRIVQLRSGHYCDVYDRFDLNQVRMPEDEDIKVTVNNDRIFITIGTPYILGRGDTTSDIGLVNIEFENSFGRYHQIASEIVSTQNNQLALSIKINDLKDANPDLRFHQNSDGNKILFNIVTNAEYLRYELTGDETITPFRFGIVTGD